MPAVEEISVPNCERCQPYQVDDIARPIVRELVTLQALTVAAVAVGDEEGAMQHRSEQQELLTRAAPLKISEVLAINNGTIRGIRVASGHCAIMAYDAESHRFVLRPAIPFKPEE